WADDLTGQGADTARLVTHRHHQGTEVVHPGGEDGTEQDPRQRRAPAPEHRHGGPDEWSGPRHRAEVVAEDDVSVGRDEVDTVPVSVRRGDAARIERIHFFRQMSRIVAVAESEHRHRREQDQGCGHEHRLPSALPVSESSDYSISVPLLGTAVDSECGSKPPESSMWFPSLIGILLERPVHGLA